MNKDLSISFVFVESAKNLETSGGYAKELDEDETTTKVVKALFVKYKNPKDLANAKIKLILHIISV